MVHKPKHKVHSFRGLLGDGGQDEINLERQNVNMVFRIVKFEILGSDPGSTENFQSVVQVWRDSQSSPGTAIDFDDPTLLAAGIYNFGGTGTAPGITITIFDNVLFSRNIFVSQSTRGGDLAVNYYLELEEVPVTSSTLMQIKLGTARRNIGGSMGRA